MAGINLQDERGLDQVFAQVVSTPPRAFEKFDLLNDDLCQFGRIDLVLGNGILQHLVVQSNVLGALHSLASPAGGLAFIETNFLSRAFIFGTRAGRRFARLESDEMAFTPSEFRQAFPAAGWRDVSVARPILAVEPALEANALTRWAAQSHFISARA